VQITQELKPDDKPKQLGLHCWHAASDQYGSQLPSKHLVFWWGYVPPVGKSQSAQARIWGLENSHIHREVGRDSPKSGVA
jgi:hypothetical protein